MQPIGPLMHEHRLIERLVALMKKELAAIEKGRAPNHRFIDEAVDFFKYYADKCHHGKEEEILFRELRRKPLSEEEFRILDELVEEHVVGRGMVKALSRANAAAAKGSASVLSAELVKALHDLSGFYPSHIEKEDKHFFHPVMRHFDRAEMNAMLAEFDSIEKRVFHERYAAFVKQHEDADA